LKLWERLQLTPDSVNENEQWLKQHDEETRAASTVVNDDTPTSDECTGTSSDTAPADKQQAAAAMTSLMASTRTGSAAAVPAKPDNF